MPLNQPTNKMVDAILNASYHAKNTQEMGDMIVGAAFALGALLCHLPAEHRGQAIMQMNQAIVKGMTNTSHKIGENENYTVVTNIPKGQPPYPYNGGIPHKDTI